MDIKAGAFAENAHEDGIWSVDWKGDRLMTGAMDGKCKLWELAGDKLEHVATSSTKSDMGVQSVSLLSSGKGGVACSQDGRISIFDGTLNSAGSINAGTMQAWGVAISHDGEAIASGNQSGQINIWASETKELNATFDTNGSFITSLTFDAQGTRLATCHMDGMVRIFDLVQQQVTHEVKAHHLPARQVCFSPDNQLLYSCSDDRHVSVFDVKSTAPVNSFSHSGMALCVDASSDGRHFMVGCADKQCVLWDLGMQRSVARLNESHTDQVWGVKFSPDGQHAASVGDDAMLMTYNL